MKSRYVFAAVIPLYFAVALLCLSVGPAMLSPEELWAGLVGTDPAAHAILFAIRLPRLLGALLSGAALSVSGVLLQGTLGNSLASPNTVGVNAGAGLFSVILLAFFPAAAPYLAPVAFLGAVAALGLILLFDRLAGGGRSTLILAGVAVTAFFSASISAVTMLFPDVFSAYAAFSVGGLGGADTPSLLLPALLVAAGVGLALLFSPTVSALSLGDGIAASLGVSVARARTLLLLLACLLAAASVSVAGLLGFVGLIAPHGARLLVGQSVRRQVALCPFLGGILVALADLVGRVAFAPSEIPAGVLLSLLGAPFFLALLMGRRKADAGM